MDDDATEEQPKAKPKAKAKPVLQGKLSRVIRGGMFCPQFTSKGDAPKVGTLVRIEVGPHIFSGIATDAIEIDGDVLIEFEDGLNAETKIE